MAEPRANPKRRWRQFSLRTLFALVTLCGVGLGVVGRELVQTRREQAALGRLGVLVRVIETDSCGLPLPEFFWKYDWRVTAIELEYGGHDTISLLATFTEMEKVVLDVYAVFDPIDFAPLVPRTKLRSLRIGRAPGRNLRSLSQLTQLEELCILDGNFDDVSAIAELKNLRRLTLRSATVADVSPLRTLENLQYLAVHGPGVEDVTSLATLAELEQLDLRETAVRKEQIEELRRALPNCAIIHEYQRRTPMPPFDE